MTESDNLAAMTLKELRKLAGERQIRNRSRLSKPELVTALQAGPAKPEEPEVLSPDTVRRSTGKEKAKPRSAADGKEDRGSRGGGKRKQDKTDGGRRGDGRRKDRKERKERKDNQDGRDKQGDGKRKQERDASRAGDGGKAKGAPTGPSKPKLAGSQRKLPSVLDRLRELSAGILELCDPETPSWAQARLSELLAAGGVHPTPCSGEPHPDYHEVVGRLATDAVPSGEIALIEVPGFCLRGDRGDLFNLRKAKVRIADHAADDGDDAPAPAAGRSGRTPAPAPAADLPTAPAPATEAGGNADVAKPPADAAEDGNADADAPTDDAPTRDREAEEGGAAPETGKAPAAADAAAARDAAGEDDAPPQRTRTSRRRKRDDHDRRRLERSSPSHATPTDRAPRLPLVPQDGEELAARPKAEGFRFLGLNDQILADLHQVGFSQPLPIQAAAIPELLTGRDLIGKALTGTGKTAAFVLPILERLYALEGEGPVALVLCPTRELARQVHAATVAMAGRSGARAALVYGGVSMDDQFDALELGPHLVIGTPGRIIDHMRRKTLSLARLRMLVLDEADQMLDIGFLPDIEYVCKHSPPERQTMLFSATMPEAIRKLALDYMREPVTVDITPDQATVDEVDQKFIAVDQAKKTDALADFIERFAPDRMLVFCRTKHQTDRVARVLRRKRMSVSAIHGDLTQARRERTLRDFRDNRLQCLIATNVAARGLDIPDVSHVVNYDVPETPEEYVHRVGRTARNGAEGVARTFITPNDGQFMLEIEKHIEQELEEEVIEGITTTTLKEVKRTGDKAPSTGPRLLKPVVEGIKLGRRRKR